MDIFILCLELIGTCAFAVSGALVGVGKRMDVFGVCILGMTTAVGGGVLRDVFAGDRPMIFVKYIYACASIVGAVVYLLCLHAELQSLGLIVGFASVFLIRVLAKKYRWSLPKPMD